MGGAPGGVIPGAPAATLDRRPFWWIAGGLALLKLVLLLGTAGRYGYFIDEFYYLACARHPAWGYVDHPPFSIALLRLWTDLFGDGLVTIRVPMALCGAGTMLLTCRLAREFGAGTFGVLLAGLTILANSAFFGNEHFYSMNGLETLLWTASLVVFARVVRGGTPRWWLALGLLLGCGLLNKVGTLWLGGGMLAGLLCTRHRRLLRTRWPWIGAALAALIFAPHVIWQVRNGWPTLEFIRNAVAEKYGGITRPAFVLSLLVEYNPFTAPFWIAGLVALVAGRLRSPYRPLGIAWLVVFGVLLANGHSRSHYLVGAIPMLSAAGGVWWQEFLAAGWRRRLRGPAAAWLVAGFGLTLPLALPLFSPDGYIAYGRAIGFSPRSAEHDRLEGMPQHIADQLGWPELVEAVAAVCDRLDPNERARACIYTGSYGAAGAIELLGRDRGLPPVISGHNNYWIWGPGKCDGSVVVAVGGARRDLEASFTAVEDAGRVPRTHGMPYRHGLPIRICRGLKGSLRDVWPAVREYR